MEEGAVKYASEVIGLLGAHPGRQFRMAEIVRYVEPEAVGSGRQRIRNGILRVLESLSESGYVEIEPASARGGFATYAWRKVPHAVSQKRHVECHNYSKHNCAYRF